MSDDLLFVDFYPADGKKNVCALASAGRPWVGAIGKTSQGVRYRYDLWFSWFWENVAKSERYGVDWFAGAYHYLDFGIDPIAQAETHVDVIEKSGGWRRGDIWPIVDVERGDQHVELTRDRVETVSQRYVARVRELTGRPMILYGGELVRSLGITSRLGCELVWVARYSELLPAATYESMGFSLDQLFGWQGVGVEGGGKIAAEWKLARATPVGKADISALTIAGGGDAALSYLRERMFVTEPVAP